MYAHATTPTVAHSSVQDFIALLKPRVSTLVALCGLVGILVSPYSLHPLLALTAVLCIGMASGGCGAINMWFERDIDARMERTSHRPVPGGRIDAADALGYGIILVVASLTLMGLALNPTAAAFLALSVFCYVFIYTLWLKRNTAQNIVIGGAAGALPPLIGWAATGAPITLYPWLLFLVIFLWTPPHFWALSLYRAQEYADAGVPMMPVVYGEKSTRIQIFLYSLALSVAALSPWFFGYSSIWYGAGALLLNAGFIAHTGGLLWRPSMERARHCFFFSIFYLYVLFALLAVDALFLAPWS